MSSLRPFTAAHGIAISASQPISPESPASVLPRSLIAVTIPLSHFSSPGFARVVANHESNVALFGLTWSST